MEDKRYESNRETLSAEEKMANMHKYIKELEGKYEMVQTNYRHLDTKYNATKTLYEIESRRVDELIKALQLQEGRG